MREQTEVLYGIPLWDLYSCEICGAALFKHTVDIHKAFHGADISTEVAQKFLPKACTICGEEINIPLDGSGFPMLDIYDDHIEGHDN